jgi:alpha-L-arabinofuranosidase
MFETDAYSTKFNRIKPDVLDRYRELPDTYFRFPGGLMANHFNWEWTLGDSGGRKPQKLAEWAEGKPVLLGVSEYFRFLEGVKGKPWYTLNLNGWSETDLNGELPSRVVADSNKRLATYIRSQTPGESVRYYHLGNELDRSVYEWPTDKYIQRSLDTIRAVSAVDPQARFVAFVRDFDYEYKHKSGESDYKDLMRDVFEAMPMVDDISFQYYYDAPTIKHPRSDLPYRLRMFREAIETATQLRGGKPPRVWVTEHGRSRHPDIKGGKANGFTSGLGSAIAAADFWIAVAQMPAIEGAFLYSVGQWNIFQNVGDSAYPLPMYWTVRVLRSLDLPVVLATETTSPNHSGYAGGYDVRVVAFTDESHGRYGLWAVNRADRDLPASIMIPALSGKKLEVTHDYLAGRQGVDADLDKEPPRVVMNQPARRLQAGNDGVLVLELPANSVSSFRLVPMQD